MVLWSVERAKHPRFVTVPQLLRDDPPPAGRRAPQVRIDVARASIGGLQGQDPVVPDPGAA